MRGITFEYASPGGAAAPLRMDVACFIGFASPNGAGDLPDGVAAWWAAAGLDDAAAPAGEVFNRPIPLESWEDFKAVFDHQRLTHQARVYSAPVADPLFIAPEENMLHLVVDRQAFCATLNSGTLPVSALAAHLNLQFAEGLDGAVRAVVQSDGQTAGLVLERTRIRSAGELTVYPNRTLGFFATVQDQNAAQDNYLGAAVKAFFRQGGRKCYVISMGDPLPYLEEESSRLNKPLQLFRGPVPGDGPAPDVNPTLAGMATMFLPSLARDPHAIEQPCGLSYLTALRDVTYVCFPDLIESFADPLQPLPARPQAVGPEVFVPCSTEEVHAPWYYTQPYRAPRCSAAGYRVWKRFVRLILQFLRDAAPNVQLVAGVPLPGAATGGEFERTAAAELFAAGDEDDDLYRRLQLAFPWLKTEQSSGLPESAEPPEGALLGLLAAGALTRGAFRSIAGSLVPQAYDLAPLSADAEFPLADTGLLLNQRVSCYDRAPAGIELRSDVTAVRGPLFRYAAVRRIMILVHKTALEAGLSHVFEASGPRVWKSLEETLSAVLLRLYRNRGLRGASSGEAFSVVCNRTTMTQQDIDNGRLVVNISFQPALPVERITVNMLIDRSGASLV